MPLIVEGCTVFINHYGLFLKMDKPDYEKTMHGIIGLIPNKDRCFSLDDFLMAAYFFDLKEAYTFCLNIEKKHGLQYKKQSDDDPKQYFFIDYCIYSQDEDLIQKHQLTKKAFFADKTAVDEKTTVLWIDRFTATTFIDDVYLNLKVVRHVDDDQNNKTAIYPKLWTAQNSLYKPPAIFLANDKNSH